MRVEMSVRRCARRSPTAKPSRTWVQLPQRRAVRAAGYLSPTASHRSGAGGGADFERECPGLEQAAEVGVRINIDVLNAQQQVFSTKRDLSKARPTRSLTV